MKKIKKKKPEIIKIPKNNVEALKDYYGIGLPKFKFKTIPKELIPIQIPSLIYYTDGVDGSISIGIIKKKNEKKNYYEIKELQNKSEYRRLYEPDQIMLVPPGSKNFKKFERYLND